MDLIKPRLIPCPSIPFPFDSWSILFFLFSFFLVYLYTSQLLVSLGLRVWISTSTLDFSCGSIPFSCAHFSTWSAHMLTSPINFINIFCTLSYIFRNTDICIHTFCINFISGHWKTIWSLEKYFWGVLEDKSFMFEAYLCPQTRGKK